MKTFSIILLIAPVLMQAQQKHQSHNPVYKTNLFATDARIMSGYLSQITDSSITLSRYPSSFALPVAGQAVRTFHYADISSLSLRRKGSMERGALAGAAGGLLIGGLATIISNSSYDPEYGYLSFQIRVPVWQGALAGAVTGAVAGTLVGLAHIKFMIKGKKERMAAANASIRKRMVLPGSAQ